jgi:hypothetical protein
MEMNWDIKKGAPSQFQMPPLLNQLIKYESLRRCLHNCGKRIRFQTSAADKCAIDVGLM